MHPDGIEGEAIGAAANRAWGAKNAVEQLVRNGGRGRLRAGGIRFRLAPRSHCCAHRRARPGLHRGRRPCARSLFCRAAATGEPGRVR